MREELDVWARGQVQLGTLEERRAASADIGWEKPVQNVTLWLDSTDVRLEKRKDVRSRKGPWHSYKLGKPAVRFWVMRDGSGLVRYCSNAGSPKFFDGHWVDLEKEVFQRIPDDVIIADTHFNEGKKIKGFPRWFGPVPQPASKTREGPERLAELTKEQQKNNAAVSHIRARIEQLFGNLKTTWASFGQPWAEEVIQLEFAFHIAIALHNKKR